MTFGARLRDLMDRRGRLCVGIDPHPALLDAWGLTDSAFGLEKFSLAVVEALGDVVPVLKPQSAFFERHGSAGIAVLEKVVAATRRQGCLTLLDVKRGDVGSTMEAYAQAYLAPGSPMRVDAVTLSPFLGFGSLSPAIEVARQHDGGVFVLALTSNPEGAQVQHATVSDGRTVAGAVLDGVASCNAGTEDLGSVGAVVGATIGQTRENLDVGGPLLVPGVGAQGGTLDDVRRIVGTASRAVLPSSSREVLAAGPDPLALRAAATRLVEQFAVLG